MTKTLTPGPVSGDLFDTRPLDIAGFSLRARAVVPVGRPSSSQWMQAMQFASSAHEAAPYWVGSLVLYARSRKDWTGALDQLMTATGLAERTLENYAWIVQNVAEPERELAPSVQHAAEVAALPVREQRKFLAKARDEGLNRRELRTVIRSHKRTRVIEGQALLQGTYRVILADPPWSYTNSVVFDGGSDATAEAKYPTLTIEQLCALPVAAHAAPNAVLFLWATAPLLMQNPGPREVLEAWGFAYKTNYVWDKVVGMPGAYSYACHEHLLVATRGSGTPDIPIRQHEHDSVIVAKRSGEHSEKPAVVRQMIQGLYPTGPYLELFGRKPAEGWTVFGNDAKLWA